ncbi:MAG: response regulator transcription factor [Sphingomonadaceae bacterium]|uniref:response regulator transcription factor n=1 Tax=Thermaurantiacus sp. TaxID=2820283 RepID=UPI00298F3C5A|nr:response regulator transcription factor [Thermaurantiacus sp.]MCS6987544.1 response regulator transcription factor [Sphingomonadaceae bacterium]MDW8415145.1 response regulator transcription factor [Thermaurantiacus sp.]
MAGRAADGAKALDLVRRLVPAVPLAGIEMPHLSGLDGAEAVAPEGLPTRVPIVTAFARPGDLHRALAAGAGGYLVKDKPADRLVEAVRTVARGGRAISPGLAEAAWDAPPNPLSPRERAVLRLAEEGRSNKEIARRLALSPGTVQNCLSAAAAKLGAHGWIEATRIARAQGWL